MKLENLERASQLSANLEMLKTRRNHISLGSWSVIEVVAGESKFAAETLGFQEIAIQVAVRETLSKMNDGEIEKIMRELKTLGVELPCIGDGTKDDESLPLRLIPPSKAA